MSLDKNDLKQITKIVGESEVRLNKKIRTTDLKVDQTNNDLSNQIESSENRVIAVIKREISDLAEINREVIKKVDKIDELEKRVVRLEHKMGIAN